MTASIRRAPMAGRGASVLGRFAGPGSIFGKTIRDSRRATIIVAGLTGVIVIAAAQVLTADYNTAQARQELRNLALTMPPILQGLAGKPVNVDTLGGFMTWKYGVFFPLIAGLWSILALSGTLAGEMGRGSLEFVAGAPIARRRIALEKLLAHVAMVALAMAVVFVLTALAGQAFARMPGDEIGIGASFAYALWLGLMTLVAGSVAFALGPFLGRAPAAGIAGAVMFAGFMLNGYQAAIPQFAPFANLTWFSWTSDFIPLAGRYDWPSLVPVAALTLVLFSVGVEAFARRDLGATSAIPWPSMPAPLLGLRDAFRRAVGEQLPPALSWAVGLGIYGLVMAASGRSFADELAKSPDLTSFFASIFPHIDMTTEGGFLELVFVEFGLVLIGLAAATLVAWWASDETTGRLEMVLSTPLQRVRWALWSGLGVFVGLAIVTAGMALGIAVGAVAAGGDVATPVAGTIVIGLYGAALAGIGLAVGGLVGSGVAAATVAALTILIWLTDFLAADLRLPDVFHEAALSSHIGQPMVGVWDGVGIVLCLALAAGGLALGTWGMRRRDVAR